MSKKIEGWVGRRFGRLVVVSEAPRSDKYVRRWNCQCDCGNTTTVFQSSLSRIKSCGCYNKEMARKRASKGFAEIFTKEFLHQKHVVEKMSLREIARDAKCTLGCLIRYVKRYDIPINDSIHELNGKRFGRLAVLSFSHSTKNNGSHWNCKCDCGAEKVIAGKQLVRGSTTSCGCYNRDKDYQGVGDLSKSYWSRLVKEACNRGLEVSITIEYAWDLFQQQNGICALTGRKIHLNRSYSKSIGKNVQTASLDRIDSDKGYISGNVQWVTLKVNRMKLNLPEDEFFALCHDVVKHRLCKN